MLEINSFCSVMGCKVSLKLHFRYFHLDFFPPEHVGAISDEHDERFYRDTFRTEKRYIGKWSANVLAHYSWSVVRETPSGENKKQKKK